MTVLNLRLQKRLDMPVRAGAVATLRRIDYESGQAVSGKDRIRVTIPANNSGEGKKVTVGPGRWLVEATLPSGELLSEEVEVAEDAGEIPVTFTTSDRSPHEYLAWQHLLGNVYGTATYSQLSKRVADATKKVSTAKGVVTKTLDDLAAAPDRLRRDLERGISRLSRQPSHVIPGLSREEAGTEAAFYQDAGADTQVQSEARGTYQVQVTFPTAAPGDPAVGWLPPSAPASGIAKWTDFLKPQTVASPIPRHVKDEENDIHLYRFADNPAPAAGRQFVQVEWGNERIGVSPPLPWIGVESRVTVPVEMVVRMDPLSKAMRVGLAPLDQAFGSIAGFMTASTLPQAAFLVEQARDLLFAKMENPLAAAAGAYVLLSAGEGEKKPDWHGWVDNLQSWFPDIPDGAIVAAWLRLRYPDSAQSQKEARQLLLDAFERGIPYFSAGITLLLDGLTMFTATAQGGTDAEVKERAQLVERIALRIDTAQAFAVIRLNEKAKPS
jgi:hypothetical protein